MAPHWTPSRTATRFTLSVAGIAAALVAAASGAQAAFPASAAAQTASTARTASTVAAASLPGETKAGPSRPAAAALDGSARPFTVTSSRRHPTPRQIAKKMLKKHYSADYQFPYLNKLWKRESGWNVHADNPSSGAYGIPQALPGSKMASAGPDWQNRAKTQIRWGLRYIRARYHSPRRAWLHELADGWYMPDHPAVLAGG